MEVPSDQVEGVTVHLDCIEELSPVVRGGMWVGQEGAIAIAPPLASGGRGMSCDVTCMAHSALHTVGAR